MAMEKKVTVSRQGMLEEVLNGLMQPDKQLPSKFFYDEEGSKLFEQITKVDEYYPTRTEISILENQIDEITEAIGPSAMLIELGSGSSNKTRILFDRLESLSAYVPVDISEEYLLKVVNQLRMEYPRVSIIPVFADYTQPFDLPDLGDSYQKQVVFFPGSTIGNFCPDRARRFMETIASITDPSAGMLIGVDLKKDNDVLETAYNDSRGLTEQFNKNMLVRLNRELDANFDVDQFAHKAFYNEREGRIEMHLVAQTDQTVTIQNTTIDIEEGESIHTENSYKYAPEEFETLVSDWYTVEQVWTDEKNYFSLQYLAKK